MSRDYIPVAPAQHYSMERHKRPMNGRTKIKGFMLLEKLRAMAYMAQIAWRQIRYWRVLFLVAVLESK